ncbi:hypothetical protein FB451DRAFT_1369000 [Mycena latifolia]|nr:hypothetical protein FB451DRAFT_1369000 [Mycena latifolia]
MRKRKHRLPAPKLPIVPDLVTVDHLKLRTGFGVQGFGAIIDPKFCAEQPWKVKEKNQPVESPHQNVSPSQTVQAPRNKTWLLVYAWVNDHPAVSQADIVITRAERALEFMQSTLPRKLANRPAMEQRVESNPNALSGKRERGARSVPVGESMEAKGESLMLKPKCARFEEQLGIPEGQRLKGDGWILPFCQTYKIKERRQYGEAGSVNIQPLDAGIIRCFKAHYRHAYCLRAVELDSDVAGHLQD